MQHQVKINRSKKHYYILWKNLSLGLILPEKNDNCELDTNGRVIIVDTNKLKRFDPLQNTHCWHWHISK
ncbi:uncharacterized protein ATC70_006427 [Mucor velutinosus]|uniref:Uncharacterized protein n=1 Tax=Mucor velutinosus TaxID=708070 RepID=A0AAN7HVW2_9FUNG|nr:hypothetical protein ATC70_006427 [Mucor velutinosus]